MSSQTDVASMQESESEEDPLSVDVSRPTLSSDSVIVQFKGPTNSYNGFILKHEMPGRLRLFCEDLKFNKCFGQSVIDCLLRVEGLEAVKINSWCGSVIINFDPNVVSKDELLLILQSVRFVGGDFSSDFQHSFIERGLLAIGKFLFSVLSQANRFFTPTVQLVVGAAASICPLIRLPALVNRALLVLSMVPISLRAVRTILEEQKLGVDALDGIAAILMLSGDRIAEASFMTGLIALGEFIREQTALRCKKIVDDLLGLSGQSAWLVKGKKRICIPASEVKVGNTIVVYPGELIPVDGVVLHGQATLDQSKLTGEAMPVEAQPGSRVFASTVLLEGKIYLTCQSTASNSHAQGILNCVDSAPLHETRIQNYASQMADQFVVPIFLAAGVCFALTRNLVRLMSMLIFDFSTGIRIAAPVAVLSSMYHAGRKGILIKNGGALERLSKVDTVVFDKTGTLTLGEPRVTEIATFCPLSQERLATLAASVEQRSHHPASRAITNYALHNGLAITERQKSLHVRGMGVKANVEKDVVLVGSRRLMELEKIDISLAHETEDEIANRGESLAFVAVNGHLAGIIAYSDHIRPEALRAVCLLKKLGIKNLIMATGDSEKVSQLIAQACGIEQVISRAFPEQKAELVKRLKKEGHVVAVIGDGINDSPALTHSDVALSLHGGTAAAQEGADLVLTDADLRRLPDSIKIARSAIQLVHQNLSLAVVPNCIGLVLASLGMIGPAGSTVLNNGSAIIAALNSLRPLYSSEWSILEESY